MNDKAYDVEKHEAQTPEQAERTHTGAVYAPNVDILETEKDITLTADMPGVDENSVDITLEKGILTIKGKVDDHGPEGYQPAWREYRVGDYERVFSLSDEIDQDGISATVKDGVLSLTLPKAKPEPAKKITVKAK